MRRNLAIGLLVTAIVVGMTFRAVALTGSSTAQTPPRAFPYQGYIEEGGAPIRTPREMVFFITDSPGTAYNEAGCANATGCRWAEPLTVDIQEGYFSVELGRTKAFPSKLFDSNNLFIRVRVANEEGDAWTTLEGAQQLLATPYAITAQVSPKFRVTEELSVQATDSAGTKTSVTPGRMRISNATSEMTISPDGISTTANALSLSPDVNVSGKLDVEGALRTSGTTTVVEGSLHATNCCVCLCWGDLHGGGDQKSVCVKLKSGSGGSFNFNNDVSGDDEMGIMFSCNAGDCGTSLVGRRTHDSFVCPLLPDWN